MGVGLGEAEEERVEICATFKKLCWAEENRPIPGNNPGLHCRKLFVSETAGKEINISNYLFFYQFCFGDFVNVLLSIGLLV